MILSEVFIRGQYYVYCHFNVFINDTFYLMKKKQVCNFEDDKFT